MERTRTAILVVLLSCGILMAQNKPTPQPPAVLDFVPIFDGKTLDGWHVSSKTGHGTGGKWYAEKGAIVGAQDKPGNGGIIATDAQFGDFEVFLEMGNDYGPDSGLFLRSTEDGRCYQAMIDYHTSGNLMGIYGEGIGGFVARNFITLDRPEVIKVENHPEFPCPFTPEQWPTVWRKGWNNLRARITGNPPTLHTWINGIKIMEWKDAEKRLGDRGMIALQIHGGMNLTGQFVRYRNVRVRELDTPDNTLSKLEKAAGWKLLFDGESLDHWKTNAGQTSKAPVQDGCINPHGCGDYMLAYDEKLGDFILALDFKMSKHCNSGVFLRTFPLVAGGDVGFNGLECQVFDSTGNGMQEMAAIYDLVAPRRNALQPQGEWNHMAIECRGSIINVELNGEHVTHMNLDEWDKPGKRPDGSDHKFGKIVWKDHARAGYIGLQDHGHDCWYKNIKLLPLTAASKPAQ